MVDVSQYKVGVILSFEGCGNQKSKNGKALKACKVDVGDDHPIVVVTSASNVRVDSRVVVAPVGTIFVDEEGAEVTVAKTAVGGVMSEGIFCDSRMLGWSGGGVGVAAQVPISFAIGSPPPSTKPRPEDEDNNIASSSSSSAQNTVGGLFEKKLSKEERKKLAAEKRLARKSAKATKNGASDGHDKDDEEEEHGEGVDDQENPIAAEESPETQ